MRFLIILLLIGLGCTKSNPNAPEYKLLSALENPILYARYDTLPTLLRSKSTLCNKAYAFKAPDRFRLSSPVDSCGPIPFKSDVQQKTPWQIPGDFKSLHWEQDLEPGQKVQVELVDSDGLPLPSVMELLKKENRSIVTLKPTGALRSNLLYLVTATVLDDSGKKVDSWSMPLKISGP